jgi:hypothetical protein
MSRRLLASFALAAAALAAAIAPASVAARVFGGADRKEPLPRFAEPLCPGVVGLQLESAQLVVGEIRQNAEALGLRLADPETCEPNVIVGIMKDPQHYFRDLRSRRPYLFTTMERDERGALFEGSSPVRAWIRAVTRTRDGMVVDRRENLVDIPRATVAAAHSKIYVPTRQDIVSAMILIDPAAIRGIGAEQLGDYATMRALGGDPAAALVAPGGTILSLFDANVATKPAKLSNGDRIFLRTLYSTMANNPAAITLAMAGQRIAEGQGAE